MYARANQCAGDEERGWKCMKGVAMQLKDRLTSPSLPLVMPAAGQCSAGLWTAAAPTRDFDAQFQEASTFIAAGLPSWTMNIRAYIYAK